MVRAWRYIATMVEVRLRAVRVDLQSNTPVLLLQEAEGEGRTLPIFIGTPEATAIAYALQGVDPPRPMTHDLIRDVLEELEIEVERVVITELRQSTYFAELQLRDGTVRRTVSSRPSDAVAVAVRTGSPLFVSDELMDSEGIYLTIDGTDDDDDADDEPCARKQHGAHLFSFSLCSSCWYSPRCICPSVLGKAWAAVTASEVHREDDEQTAVDVGHDHACTWVYALSRVQGNCQPFLPPSADTAGILHTVDGLRDHRRLPDHPLYAAQHRWPPQHGATTATRRLRRRPSETGPSATI